GSLMYASDFRGNFTAPSWVAGEVGPGHTTASCDRSGSDDDASWLFPTYISAIGGTAAQGAYDCPSTQNYIRPAGAGTTEPGPGGTTVLIDLTNNAQNKGRATGTSYEIFGTWQNLVDVTGGTASIPVKKTENNINSYVLTKCTTHMGMK